MNMKKILFYALAALGGGAFADNPIAVKPTLAELPATFQILPEKDCYDLSFIAQCDEGSGKIEAVIAFWKNGEEMSSERGGNISLRFDINSTTVCSSPVQIPHGADSAKIRMRAFLDLSANINVCNVRFMPGLDSAENSGAESGDGVSYTGFVASVSAVVDGRNVLGRKAFNPEVVLQKARAAAKTESDNGQSIPASQNVYYVDPDYGSDENSGEYAYAAGRAGPKRTIHGALEGVESGGAQSSEIVLSGNSNKPHRTGVVSMPGKTLIIRTQGTAIIKGGEQ